MEDIEAARAKLIAGQIKVVGLTLAQALEVAGTKYGIEDLDAAYGRLTKIPGSANPLAMSLYSLSSFEDAWSSYQAQPVRALPALKGDYREVIGAPMKNFVDHAPQDRSFDSMTKSERRSTRRMAATLVNHDGPTLKGKTQQIDSTLICYLILVVEEIVFDSLRGPKTPRLPITTPVDDGATEDRSPTGPAFNLVVAAYKHECAKHQLQPAADRTVADFARLIDSPQFERRLAEYPNSEKACLEEPGRWQDLRDTERLVFTWQKSSKSLAERPEEWMLILAGARREKRSRVPSRSTLPKV